MMNLENALKKYKAYFIKKIETHAAGLKYADYIIGYGCCLPMFTPSYPPHSLRQGECLQSEQV
jgi:hypothetical protein